MQISSINSQTFKGYYKNSAIIEKLKDKEIEMKCMSEGFNGGLNSQDQKELELRRELMTLMEKAAAISAGSEGFNASLSEGDLKRMLEIQEELKKFEKEYVCPGCTAETPDKYTERKLYSPEWTM